MTACLCIENLTLSLANASPTLRCGCDLAILHLRRNVHYPFASRDLVESSNFDLPDHKAAEYPTNEADRPVIWVLFHRAHEGKGADGLDDRAVHGVHDGLLKIAPNIDWRWDTFREIVIREVLKGA